MYWVWVREVVGNAVKVRLGQASGWPVRVLTGQGGGGGPGLEKFPVWLVQWPLGPAPRTARPQEGLPRPPANQGGLECAQDQYTDPGDSAVCPRAHRSGHDQPGPPWPQTLLCSSWHAPGLAQSGRPRVPSWEESAPQLGQNHLVSKDVSGERSGEKRTRAKQTGVKGKMKPL